MTLACQPESPEARAKAGRRPGIIPSASLRVALTACSSRPTSHASLSSGPDENDDGEDDGSREKH